MEEGETYLETDIDELYEMVKKKGLLKVKSAAKKFRVKREQIEEWGRILEEHDLAILHYPPFGDPVIILKKFKPKAKIKHGKFKIKHKKALFVNLIIILAFVIFILWYTGRLYFEIPDLGNALSGVLGADVLDFFVQNQIYLMLVIIIIIALVLIVTGERRGAKNKGKRRGKHGKK
jgi:flagellar biogenesis protein FliO